MEDQLKLNKSIGFVECGLEVDQAIGLLQQADPSCVSSNPPVKPQGGEIFLVNCGEDVEKQNVWKCDQYQWNLLDETKILPSNNPTIIKIFTSMGNSGAFRREAWRLMKYPRIVLVHYVGDHTTYMQHEKENANNNPNHYAITYPSVMCNKNTEYPQIQVKNESMLLKEMCSQNTSDNGTHMDVNNEQLQLNGKCDQYTNDRKDHLDNHTFEFDNTCDQDSEEESPQVDNELVQSENICADVNVEQINKSFESREKPLKTSEAITILQSIDPTSISIYPPFKPLGGEMFFVNCGEDDWNHKNWMRDQYRWKYQRGTQKLPYKADRKAEVIKTYISMEKSGAFRKEAWRLIEKPSIVLVHYIGDPTTAIALLEQEVKKVTSSKVASQCSTKNIPIQVNHRGLNFNQATKILKDSDLNCITSRAPYKPKGGEMFLVNCRSSKSGGNWKSDKYQWKCKRRTYNIPRYYSTIIKGLQKRDKSGAFRRETWELIDNPGIILVHYIGDHTAIIEDKTNMMNITQSIPRPLPKRDGIPHQKTHGLKRQEATKMLQEAHPEVLSSEPPIKPHAGEVFLVNCGNEYKNRKWKHDQYHWKIEAGIHKLPKDQFDNPPVYKSYSRMDRLGLFRREAWWLVDNPSIVLIHYIGDHTDAILDPKYIPKSLHDTTYRSLAHTSSNGQNIEEQESQSNNDLQVSQRNADEQGSQKNADEQGSQRNIEVQGIERNTDEEGSQFQGLGSSQLLAQEKVNEPFGFRETTLKTNEAVEILEDAYTKSVNACPPVRPKGGEMFLVNSGDDEFTKNDWRKDQYKWKCQKGVARLPSGGRSKPIITKCYVSMEKDGVFRKEGWRLIDKPSIVLVHYLGDHTTAISLSDEKNKYYTPHKPLGHTNSYGLNSQNNEDQSNLHYTPLRPLTHTSSNGLNGQNMDDQVNHTNTSPNQSPEDIVNEAFGFRETPLKVYQAVEILEKADPKCISGYPAVLPRGGEMFFVNSGGDDKKKDDWKCDQYRWKYPGGSHGLPTNGNPIITKYYGYLNELRLFQRHGWRLIKNPSITLVHYLGDHTTFTPEKHGNSKKTDRIYVRTCPSIVVDQKADAKEGAMVTYRKQIGNTCPAALTAVLHPRTKHQVYYNKNAKRVRLDDENNSNSEIAE